MFGYSRFGDLVRPFVLLAAARFRYAGALVAAGVAMLLSGPMRPAVDAVSDQQPPSGSVAGWCSRWWASSPRLIDRIVSDRERELELAEQERDFAVRQAAVIATVSHEFRTPLTVITGVARTLEVHGMVSGEGESLLTGLMDSARRLTDLVNTIGAVMDGSPDQKFVRLEAIVMRDVMDHVLDHLGCATLAAACRSWSMPTPRSSSPIANCSGSCCDT